MELALTAFVIYVGSSITAAAVITALVFIDVMLTDRQYPETTGLAIVLMSALIGVVAIVGVLSMAYVMAAGTADAVGIMIRAFTG